MCIRSCRLPAVVLIALLTLTAAGCDPVWNGKLVLSPDGQRLALMPPGERNQPRSLLVLSCNGKTMAKTAGVAESATDSEPAFSPDGKSLAFWRVAWPADEAKGSDVLPAPATVELVLRPLDGGRPRVLIRWQTTLEWDAAMAVSGPPRFSPDGKLIAVTRLGDAPDKLDPHVELIDPAGQAPPRRIAEDCLGMQFIAGGRELAALTFDGGLKTFMARQLAPKENAPTTAKEQEEPKPVLVRFDLAGGRELGRRPFPEFSQVVAQTARDGFILSDEGGARAVDPVSGKARPLWAAGASMASVPFFTPDGRFVAAVAAAAAPTTQPEQDAKLPAGVIPALPPGGPDGDTLFLLDRDNAAGGWRKLHASAWPMRIQQPTVSDDGRTVSFIEYDNGYRQVEGEQEKKKVGPEHGRLIVLDVPSGKTLADRDLLATAAPATQPD